MTVSGSVLKNVYVLDESTTVFPYEFKILQDSDMKVILYNTTTLTETVLTLTTDYTVSGAGNDSGTRNVTYSDASSYGSTYQLILKSNVAYTQPTDYEENDDFAEATHETALDRTVIQNRQTKELVDRCLKLNTAQEDEISIAPAEGYLYSDGGGTYSFDTITSTSTDYDATISKGALASRPAVPSTGDVYIATDVKIIYYCYGGSTWTASTTIQVPSGGTLTINNSSGDTVATIDEIGNMVLLGNITTQGSF